MNDKGSSSPSNYSNNSLDNMHTDNQDDVATAVVDEAGVTIITQDENNTHDEATAVDDEAEERIITQDKSPKRSITFDDQTAMVSKRKKDNEKKNTVTCFAPKEMEFKNYLEVCFKSTEKKTWHLVTTEKVKNHVFLT